MTHKIILPVLTLALALLACSLSQATPAATASAPIPPSKTAIPATATQPAVPVTPTDTTVPTTVNTSLTVAMLRNGTYYAPVFDRTVTLVDGAYSETSAAGTYSVQMHDTIAFGDLNNDGIPDAAILLVENGGGSGSFVSVLAILNQAGTPFQVGQVEIGDRVVVTSMTITTGTLALDLLVQAPDDPMCCPSQIETQSYQLNSQTLWLTKLTSLTPDDQERSISVDTPPDGSSVTNPFTVSGSVSIAPFENTLAARIFLPDGTKVNDAPVIVDSGGNMGAPGTFSQSFDLGNAGISGPIIVQFLDLSAADGSTLALGSVTLDVH